MQRHAVLVLRTLSGLLALANALPVNAQQVGAASHPLSCYAHPEGLRAGDYAWDAPACLTARTQWQADQVKRANAASTSNLGTGGDASSTTLLVPAGTAVPIHVVGTLSSGSAKPDDTFAIQVAADVILNDMVVFRKGAGGEGHIVDSNSAGGNGHSGAITLALDYVFAADGGRVMLSQSTQNQAEEDRKGASSTATIIGFATFGIGGLFGHNLARGRQKTIDEKTTIMSFVASNVHVQTSEHAVTARYDK